MIEEPALTGGRLRAEVRSWMEAAGSRARNCLGWRGRLGSKRAGDRLVRLRQRRRRRANLQEGTPCGDGKPVVREQRQGNPACQRQDHGTRTEPSDASVWSGRSHAAPEQIGSNAGTDQDGGKQRRARKGDKNRRAHDQHERAAPPLRHRPERTRGTEQQPRGGNIGIDAQAGGPADGIREPMAEQDVQQANHGTQNGRGCGKPQ